MAVFTPKQISIFKKHKRGLWSLRVLILAILVSALAPFFSNNAPLVMKYQGKWYFPIFQTLTPSHLGIESPFHTIDFKELKEKSADMWALWPIIPYHPNESDRSLDEVPSKPDSKHWLGTDDTGRDVLSRIIYGFRNALLYTVTVWFFSFLIGTVIGGLQGYFGGPIDFFVQRTIEVLSSIPTFFLMIIVVSMVQPNLLILAALSVLVGGWISISYYVRAEFLRLRQLEFVEAARAQGLSRWRIIFRHILPNSMSPIITFTPFKLTAGITGLAGLDYLGFGLPPPSASWGQLLNQAQKYIDHAWWLAVFPSLALILTLLLLNFVGEAAREAFDPRNG
jgi:microcin C transport system permease protein